MAKLAVGDRFPAITLQDIHEATVEFPAVFAQAKLIRAVSAENEGHWAGLISAPIAYVVDPNAKVRWAYVSERAADRP
ncbi:MAG TPA: hypothetical protein VK603_26030, partial [Candidatus Saccharimonadales bacterium]|nr:hypothetical protein [Candidatus Saccharimonadales bacterium]